MSGEGMGLWTPDKWRASRRYELTKRKVWQDERRKWGGFTDQAQFQHIAKAWKDGYDIGFKEIDDGDVVST